MQHFPCTNGHSGITSEEFPIASRTTKVTISEIWQAFVFAIARSLSLSHTLCFLFNAKDNCKDLLCRRISLVIPFLISLRQCHFSGDRYTPSPTRKVLKKICFQVTFPRGDSDTEPLAVGDDISDLCLGRRNRTEIKSRVKIGRLSPYLVRSYLS